MRPACSEEETTARETTFGMLIGKYLQTEGITLSENEIGWLRFCLFPLGLRIMHTTYEARSVHTVYLYNRRNGMIHDRILA